MSCFSPNLMEARKDLQTGQVVYLFLGRADMTNPKEYGTPADLSKKGSYKFLVPCGHCLGCHIDYSRNWANRMILELQDNPKAIFVTLTYDDDHLPISDSMLPTLSVRDVQLFFKRLRKKFSGIKIRYYLAGEYGPTTHRPHYHAIIYGLELSDFSDLVYVGCNKLRQPYYSSELFAGIWGNGFVQMSNVSYRTCAYVARYVLKKHYKADVDFMSLGIHSEFNLSSRKPGIGMLHAESMVISGECKFALDGRDGVHDIYLSKAFYRHCSDKAKKNFDYKMLDFLSTLQYNRCMEANDRLVSKLLYTERRFYEYLSSEEAKLSGKIKLLPERL